MKSVAFVMLVMPLLIGCQHHREIPVDVAIEEMDQHTQAAQLEESYYFRIPRRDMRYKKLSRNKLDELIRHQIEVLKTPLWREAKATLISIGKPAVPLLIESLPREDESAAEQRPRPGPKFDSDRMFNTLGEVSWSVLTDMILRHSDVPARGRRLPERHRQQDWNNWWKRYGSRIVISGPLGG